MAKYFAIGNSNNLGKIFSGHQLSFSILTAEEARRWIENQFTVIEEINLFLIPTIAKELGIDDISTLTVFSVIDSFEAGDEILFPSVAEESFFLLKIL